MIYDSIERVRRRDSLNAALKRLQRANAESRAVREGRIDMALHAITRDAIAAFKARR